MPSVNDLNNTYGTAAGSAVLATIVAAVIVPLTKRHVVRVAEFAGVTAGVTTRFDLQQSIDGGGTFPTTLRSWVLANNGHLNISYQSMGVEVNSPDTGTAVQWRVQYIQTGGTGVAAAMIDYQETA